MLDRYPVTPYEEALRADAMDRSPVELQVRGDRAYLGSKHPARGFVPVLMVREQGLWRIDLVETFKGFFFDKDSVFRLANEASPYAEFAEPWLRRRDETLAPLDLGGESLEAAIARLEASTRAEDRFRLAELLMRNCFISAEAIPLYAEAARAAPSDSKIVLTYARRAGYLYMPIIAADAVAGLGPSYWTELAFLYESSGERELARQYYAKALDRNPGNDYARSALARLTSH
jgi:tetratricopeptide (TPR) repeat protein